MRHFCYPLFIMCAVLFLAGCADVKTPTAHYAITHPLSTKSMVISGSSKEEIIEKWGNPDEILEVGYDDMGLKKEAWIYQAWFEGAPLDYRQFSRAKKIYFTGDYATGYEDVEKDE